MSGEDMGEIVPPEEREQSFAHKPLWKRTLIVAAGPGFNFFLSYLIFSAWLAMGAPLPIPTFAELSPTIDAIRADSPAAQAGLHVGDRVTRIDEREITTKNEVYATVAESDGRSLTVEVRRGDTLKTYVVTPELYDPEDVEHPLYVIGIEEAAPVVTAVMPEMPAAQAGLEEGDRILEIQGEPIQTWSQMTRIIKAHPE